MASIAMSSTHVTTAQSPPHTHTASSQRLKKREYDRKAQRNAREKRKKRIAQLESLVEKLNHQDDNATTASLVAQLSKVTEQRNKLMNCLRTTSSSLGHHLKETESWNLDDSTGGEPLRLQPMNVEMPSHNTSSPRSSGRPTAFPMPVQESLAELDHYKHNDSHVSSSVNQAGLEIGQIFDVMFEPDFPATTPSMRVGGSQAPSTTNAGSTERHSINLAETESGPLMCQCSSVTRLRRLSDGSQVSCNNWKAGNEILGEPFVLSDAVLSLENDTSEDIPVHAVIHGWDSLAHSGKITPLWRKVRQLDELCFSACGQAERLAVLYIIHLLMRAYADPSLTRSALIPQWYLKSPLQGVAYDPSANYFAWPALRYRFAVSPHRYCGNEFWYMFKEHLRIVWAYAFRDCYLHNVQLGTYNLSPLFKERVFDLGSWTMEPDFFDRFPEMRQDIPNFPGQPSPSTMYNFASSRYATTPLGIGMTLTGADARPKTGSEDSPGQSKSRDSEEQYGLSADFHVSGFLLSEISANGTLDCTNMGL